MKTILVTLFIFNFFTTLCAGSLTINNDEPLKDLGENFDLEACIKNHDAPIIKLRIEKIALNQFPQFIFSLNDLTELYLIECGLQGPIPVLIGKLNKLEVLDLSHNELSGAVPENIQKLQKLKKLVLSHNKFSSLSNIVRLDCLTHLDVQHNKSLAVWYQALFGQLPQSLLELKANNCSVKARLPALANCRNLELIDFSNNRMEGEIPSNWADFHNLKKINLAYNCLNGYVPQKFWQLYQLESLSISFNQDLAVSVLPEIQHLDNLKCLGLYKCRMQGTLPQELKKTNLKTLVFGPAGDFSESIHAMPSSLDRLYCGLSKNSFDIANFPLLRSFDAHREIIVRNAQNHEFEVKLPISDNFKTNLKNFFKFQTGIASITIYFFNNGVDEGTIHCFYDEQGCRQITLSHVEKESAPIPLDHLLESAATPNNLFARELPDELAACAWELPAWAQELEPIVSEINQEFAQEQKVPSCGDKRVNDGPSEDEPKAKKGKF